MGATEEDVMGDWNNVPRRVTVSSFYIDKTEVANIHYREYLRWIEKTFDDPMYENVINAAKPDTLVWRKALSANEPLVESYFRHPSYNDYPVVGVSWRQANDFCIWRSNRVNELILVQKDWSIPINSKHFRDKLKKILPPSLTCLEFILRNLPSQRKNQSCSMKMADPVIMLRWKTAFCFPNTDFPLKLNGNMQLWDTSIRIQMQKQRR